MPPSISSTSGTWTHGGSVTISGSSFGSKGGTNANKPLIWADFEANINPTSLGHTTSWSSNENFALSSTNLYGQVSAQHVVGEWLNPPRQFTFHLVHTFTSKLYISSKRYFDFAVTANQKFFRLNSDTGGTDFAASTVSGGACLDEFCTTQAGRFQAVSMLEDAWMMHEFLWRKATTQDCGGTNTGNGYYEFINGGVQDQVFNDTMISNTAAAYGQGGGLSVLDNFTDSANQPASGSKVYQDDIYVDDTWARVIVGNASTLATSTTTREIQIPSAWADTSITITVNRGAFGASATAYLYAVDSANAVNATGFEITFGAGGGAAPQANIRTG